MVSIGCYSTHTISMTHCWDYWTHKFDGQYWLLFHHTQSVWHTAAAENTGHTEHCTHLQVWWSVLVVIPHTHNQYDLLLIILNTQNIVLIFKFDGQYWFLFHTHTISMTSYSCWEYWIHRTLYSSTSLMVSIGCYYTTHNQYDLLLRILDTQNIVLIYKFDGEHWLLFHTHTISRRNYTKMLQSNNWANVGETWFISFFCKSELKANVSYCDQLLCQFVSFEHF